MAELGRRDRKTRRAMFRHLGVLAGLGLTGGFGLLKSSLVKAGEDPSKYRVVGNRYSTQARASDGRVFTFVAAECQNIRTGQVDAIIVSVERPNRPPERRVILKKNVPEFTNDLACRGYNKSLIGDFVGGIKDVADAVQQVVSFLSGDYVKSVINALIGVAEAIKTLIAKILALYGVLSGNMAQEMGDAGGAQTVARHALNIRDVCVAFHGFPPSQKFIISLERTLANDPTGRITVAAALGIIKS